MGEKVWGLPEYLNRPWTRIDDYVTILQDVTKYRCVYSAFSRAYSDDTLVVL